jgi:protein TonB
MRGAVVGSALVHLALLVGMFAAQTRAPRLLNGPDVMRVALLEPTAMPAAPPAPAPKPEPVVPDLKPEEGSGVKVTPPRPKPPKKEVKPATPEPPPQVSIPAAPLGRPGLQGDVTVDSGDFEFNYYLLLLRNRIAQNWAPPAGLVSGGQPIRAVVYFRVVREGNVLDVRLETTSTADMFDRSALRAVVLSDPLPPLPDGFKGASLGVHFGFEYTTP